MSGIIFYPDHEELERASKQTPDHMHPNEQPYAVALPGILTPEECDEIERLAEVVPHYVFPHCDARTRELGHRSVLDGLKAVAEFANGIYWQYDLDPEPFSWMQEYIEGGSYPLHMDGAPGQMRKLTAVLQLSNPSDYSGGNLELQIHPNRYVVPKERGTVVVFLPWILHEVTPIRLGLRQTINMGFYGPAFR